MPADDPLRHPDAGPATKRTARVQVLLIALVIAAPALGGWLALRGAQLQHDFAPGERAHQAVCQSLSRAVRRDGAAARQLYVEVASPLLGALAARADGTRPELREAMADVEAVTDDERPELLADRLGRLATVTGAAMVETGEPEPRPCR